MSLRNRINELFDAYPSRRNTDLAKYVGCSRSTVTDWRIGKTKEISGPFSHKVAEFFGVSAKWVQTGLGKKDLQPNDVRVIVQPPNNQNTLDVKPIMTPTLIRSLSGLDDPDLNFVIYALITIKKYEDRHQTIQQAIDVLTAILETEKADNDTPERISA
jgi:hypothetical protein